MFLPAVLAPELTTDIRTAETLPSFCHRLGTHLFRWHLGYGIELNKI